MSDNSKVTAAHLRRLALVYVRQSTTSQVEYNRESTQRQYRLAERASELGWQREQIKVLDQISASRARGWPERAGFTHMTAEVALGQVGIVLGLRSRGWRAITPTGIGCSTSAAPPMSSSAMLMASIIRACLTIGWYSDSAHHLGS